MLGDRRIYFGKTWPSEVHKALAHMSSDLYHSLLSVIVPSEGHDRSVFLKSAKHVNRNSCKL